MIVVNSSCAYVYVSPISVMAKNQELKTAIQIHVYGDFGLKA